MFWITNTTSSSGNVAFFPWAKGGFFAVEKNMNKSKWIASRKNANESMKVWRMPTPWETFRDC